MVMPWDFLVANGWTIAVMNHYKLDGELYIFCLMTKGDKAIKAEGKNSHCIFTELGFQAGII